MDRSDNAHSIVLYFYDQALAGEVGMSTELDDVAKSLFNASIPAIWRRLAPITLKSLGNWIIHFQKRLKQYYQWVSTARA